MRQYFAPESDGIDVPPTTSKVTTVAGSGVTSTASSSASASSSTTAPHHIRTTSTPRDASRKSPHTRSRLHNSHLAAVNTSTTTNATPYCFNYRSPLITEGRYVYILSVQPVSPYILSESYCVDIYDPLNRMLHIRRVVLRYDEETRMYKTHETHKTHKTHKTHETQHKTHETLRLVLIVVLVVAWCCW
jgi:hypothetical protein